MARARNIKPAFFINDELAEIEPLGRLLFIGLWTIADKAGRLEDRPKKIKAACLPYDNCDVDSMLNQLWSKDFIIRYEIDGEGYIQIAKWDKHQSPHYKEQDSEIPPISSNNNIELTLSQDQSNVEPTSSQACPLIPDSLNLIPDSGFPHPDSGVSEEDPEEDIKIGIESIIEWFRDKTGQPHPIPQKTGNADRDRLKILVKHYGAQDLIVEGEKFLAAKLAQDGKYPFNIRYLLTCWENSEENSRAGPEAKLKKQAIECKQAYEKFNTICPNYKKGEKPHDYCIYCQWEIRDDRESDMPERALQPGDRL